MTTRAAADPLVLSELRACVATLTINRPGKRNALSAALVDALVAALARTASDPGVRVVAIRGAGPDFCAGADLEELARGNTTSEADNLADARRMGALFLALRRHPRPVIAVVTGRALGGGAGLATACDVTLAHERAELGFPEVRLGFVPALVMTVLRRKLPEAAALELMVSGRRIGAEEAARLGLVRMLPEAGFEQAADRYLVELAERPPSAMALTKRLFYELGELSFEDGLERAARVNAEARMSEECREGVQRFLTRSSPRR